MDEAAPPDETAPPGEALRIGAVMRRAWRMLRRHWWLLLPLGFLGAFTFTYAPDLFLPSLREILQPMRVPPGAEVTLFLLAQVLALLLPAGVLASLPGEARTVPGARRRALGLAARRLPVLLVIGIVWFALFAIPFTGGIVIADLIDDWIPGQVEALIVITGMLGGGWVLTRYFGVLAVATRERHGIAGAFARARRLQAGAGWRIVALLLITLVFGILIPGLLTALGIWTTFTAPLLIAEGGSRGIETVIANIFGPGLTAAIFAIIPAATYAELRRIEDGPTPEDVADVFG